MTTDTKVVEVRLPLERSMPVLGYTTEVPGLIVTPRATTHRVKDDEFNVTHEASGWSVLRNHNFNSVEVARLFAVAIKDLLDWTMDREEFEVKMNEIDRDAFSAELKVAAVQVETTVESDPVRYLGIKVDDSD